VSIQDKRRSSIEITHARTHKQTNIEYTTEKQPEQKPILLPFLVLFLFPQLAQFYQRVYVCVPRREERN
jgi:hypothetical protein